MSRADARKRKLPDILATQAKARYASPRTPSALNLHRWTSHSESEDSDGDEASFLCPPSAPPSASSSSSSSSASSAAAVATSGSSGSASPPSQLPPTLSIDESCLFHRVSIVSRGVDEAEEEGPVSKRFLAAISLRRQFQWDPVLPRERVEVSEAPEYQRPGNHLPARTLHVFRMLKGVMQVFADEEASRAESALFAVPSMEDFGVALHTVMGICQEGPPKSFAHKRLSVLEARFHLHTLLNHHLEHEQQKMVPHRDFYNVRKIDNHVHHSACMNQKHLLRFIKSKMKHEPNEVVTFRDGHDLTLAEVFRSLKLTPYDLSIDTLDMHAAKTFQRFDKFNLKYNPVGESRLREIFLKFSNKINGRYLAELTQQVFDDLVSNKYAFAEYRVSIYGKNRQEWDDLARWVEGNNLYSANSRWMVQIPRIFAEFRAAKLIGTFQDMIDNIFLPLFEVSVDPSSHPNLHIFLQSCVGFDSVDDESQREREFQYRDSLPSEWVVPENPPYSMFSYYIYANLQALNRLRHAKGFNTFAYRPHAGEAGDAEHLAACFLLARSINHGLVLKKNPALQYLYYLAQIGISMSPLSNNLLFVEYDKNPFPQFFARGLNVTLSTDDPLMIHVTKEPLVEEYSVAAQVWKLSSVDMCEIARNSVLQSGFEHRFKAHWLGNDYFLRSVSGNDMRQTNVPDVRIEFRVELLLEEYSLLHKLTGGPDPMLDGAANSKRNSMHPHYALMDPL